jgi:hypothetical protein
MDMHKHAEDNVIILGEVLQRERSRVSAFLRYDAADLCLA